jgi:hypothetical protein
VRSEIARAIENVWGAHYKPRDLWHLGLGWCQAVITARAECAHVFAELYHDEELVCCPNGLSMMMIAHTTTTDDGGGSWRGYLALDDDDEIAAGDLVLWRHQPPRRLPLHGLPVEMRPLSTMSALALARLRQAWAERRCARFARADGVEIMRFAPRVHGVNGARRARLAPVLPTPPRLSARERRLFLG